MEYTRKLAKQQKYRFFLNIEYSWNIPENGKTAKMSIFWNMEYFEES